MFFPSPALIVGFCLSLSSSAFAQEKVMSEEDAFSAKNAATKESTDSEELKRADPKPVPPPDGQFPAALLKLGEAFSPYAFVMDKSSRTLSVWKNGADHPELVTFHPADIGRKPGNKTALGDHRTPEGIYFFEKQYETQQLNYSEYGPMAFTTDYPNFFDRLDKKTGNGIWLHAIPSQKSLWRGSRGCVVVRDNIIKTLQPYIRLGETPIVVAPKVEYVPETTLRQMRSRFLTWLETWRTQWETKMLDAYIENYDSSFSSLGMNRDQWRKYKKNLSEKYSYIKVQLKEPTIYFQDGKMVARFYQVYNSDQNSDFGEKTLFVKIVNGAPKILGEVWAPVADQTIAKKFSAESLSESRATSSSM